jgi:hypothetical protein
MIVPGRMSIGPGVRTWKRRNSGVMRCRLRASEKNRKTSSRGRGSHCQVERLWDGKLRSKLLEVGVREWGVDLLVTTISPALYLFGLFGW